MILIVLLKLSKCCAHPINTHVIMYLCNSFNLSTQIFYESRLRAVFVNTFRLFPGQNTRELISYSIVSPLILQIRSLSCNLIEAGYNISFSWVPAQVGISGYKIAGDLPKRRSLISMSPSKKNLVSDLVPMIRRHILSLWNQKWSSLLF